jgi:hypothetical protein
MTMKKAIALWVLAVLLGMANSWPAGAGESSAIDGVSEALDKLESLLPDHPAIADREVNVLMRKAAETRRLDAAYLLIRCLAFNLNPDATLESLGLAEMIPAVSLLQRKYGDKVLPILFVEGITVEKPWLRKRIAFTIREIADPARIAQLSDVFNLKWSDAEGAKDLAALLAAKEMDVELYDPAEEMLKDLGKKLERLDKQHQ